jgi:hypothetical protein
VNRLYSWRGPGCGGMTVTCPWPTACDILMTKQQVVFKMLPLHPSPSFCTESSELPALWDKRRRLETKLDVIKTDGGRALQRKLR